MSIRLSQTAHAQQFLEEASGNLNDAGNPRTKALIYRILRDTVNIIEDLEVTPEEFWKAVNYLNELGKHQEAGLLAAGLGLEHYLDLLMDAADEEAGKSGGTPRTIEGPLYVAGAPLSKYEARLDDGKDDAVPLFMRGQVRDTDGKPLAGAIVDVWQANTGGLIRGSTRPNPNSTCADASRLMPRATTGSAVSCHRATVAHQPGRPSNCWINSDATGSGRRISTSSFRRRGIGT